MSFSKYGAPALEHPLPAAASLLTAVRILDAEAPERVHFRRCPSCAALFAYRLTYDYQANGSEDEETLTRLPPDESAAFLRREGIRLEAIRREVDCLENEAGRLGDYIDRGRPVPAEEREAFDRMQALRRTAEEIRRRLAAQVEAFRETCPEILELWAGAHIRVCRSYLEAGFPPGPDASTALFTAREALAAWEALPRASESFVSVDSPFLPGYSDRIAAELNR